MGILTNLVNAYENWGIYKNQMEQAKQTRAKSLFELDMEMNPSGPPSAGTAKALRDLNLTPPAAFPKENIFSIGQEGLKSQGQVPKGSKVFPNDPYALQAMKNEMNMQKLQMQNEMNMQKFQMQQEWKMKALEIQGLRQQSQAELAMLKTQLLLESSPDKKKLLQTQIREGEQKIQTMKAQERQANAKAMETEEGLQAGVGDASVEETLKGKKEGRYEVDGKVYNWDGKKAKEE